MMNIHDTSGSNLNNNINFNSIINHDNNQEQYINSDYFLSENNLLIKKELQEKEVMKFNIEIEELNNIIIQLREENENLKNNFNFEAIESNILALTVKIKSQKEKIKMLISENSDLKNKYKESPSRLINVNDVSKDFKDQINILESKNLRLENKVKELTHILSKKKIFIHVGVNENQTNPNKNHNEIKGRIHYNQNFNHNNLDSSYLNNLSESSVLNISKDSEDKTVIYSDNKIKIFKVSSSPDRKNLYEKYAAERDKNREAKYQFFIDELTKKNKEIADNEEVIRKLKIFEDRCSTQKEKLRTLEKEIQDLNEQIRSLTIANRENLDMFVMPKIEREEEIYTFRKQKDLLENYENKNKKLKSTIEKFKDSQLADKELIKNLNHEIDQFKKEVNLKNISVNNLKEKIDILYSQLDGLNNKQENCKACFKKQNENNKLVIELEETKEKIEFIKREYKDKYSQLKNSKPKIKDNISLNNSFTESRIKPFSLDKKLVNTFSIISLQKDKLHIKKNDNKSLNMSKNLSDEEELSDQRVFVSKEKSEKEMKINIYMLNNKSEDVQTDNLKLKIVEGSNFIYRVYDNKRIICFEIERKIFRLIEFSDFGNFETNYNSHGSIHLNNQNGFFIITGENSDLFFYFNSDKTSMYKLANLKDNHYNGSLILHKKANSLLCLSGWHNKKVERYINDEILCYTDSSSNSKNKKRNIINQNKNTWTNLSEMTVERSECSSIIINDEYLYSFFGYCCPKTKYLDSIERFNLNNESAKWEIVKYHNENHLSTFIKSTACILHTNINNETEIMFLGGYDGKNETAVENFYIFDLKTKKIDCVERKYPKLKQYHCYNFHNDSNLASIKDDKNKQYYVGFDDNDRVHIIEANSLMYDIISFD